MQMLLLGLASMSSSLLQAVTGFGFGIVMMAIMPLFLPYAAALNISTILSLSLNLTILARCWKHINWKLLAFPALFCIMGSSAGMWLMHESPSPIYKRLLGVFLVCLAIWFYFFSGKVRIKRVETVSLSAFSVPRCSDAMAAAMGRPRPKPDCSPREASAR